MKATDIAPMQPMTREHVTDMIIVAKVKKGLKWADVAKKVGQSKEWATAALPRPDDS